MWIKIASAMMAAGIMLGAFGAHALKNKLSAYSLNVYNKAVFYHFIHALGLFVIGWLSTQTNDPKIHIAGFLLFGGILIFSGSLYALALTDIKWLGAITPLGGLAFIAGWILLTFTRIH